MKPAHRTITYVVYSPNYVPGKGKYKKVKSLKDALKQCRKNGFGVGSEIDRHFHTQNRKGTQYIFPEAVLRGRKWRGPWVYHGG